MIFIAGTGPLALAIEQHLRESGRAVERYDSAPDQLKRASALILAADDDAGNVDLALQARQIKPGLRLVVRLFDSALASYLAETLPGITLLSMSAVTAPLLAETAKRILADPAPHIPHQSKPKQPESRYRVDRVLLIALSCLFLLVFPSALYFSHALDLSYIDALYFVWTTVMTVGYGDISLKDASAGVKLFGMALMLGGAGFIAVLFALISDWVLSRRLDMLYGRTRVHGHGHILIFGAGNMGVRIAGLLADSGQRLVIVERNAESRNTAALRMAGHHVVIADATHPETIALAALERAALVIAVTDTDAVNLQIALHAKAAAVPVIVRMDSPALSAHIRERGDGIAFSPVVVAAEAFAQSAVGN